jgi:hypothetical protein
MVSLLLNCLLICPSNEVVQDSHFSTILPIVCVAGIDRSGKSEANVAWKLLKKDPL